MVHWRYQHCQLCLAGGPTSWKRTLLNFCILTFRSWWVYLSWTPPCQKEQETKTGKTVVRIWILPSRTQGVTTIAVALLFKSHFWASTKKPFTKLKITRESQVRGKVAVALQHLIKDMVSKLGGQGLLDLVTVRGWLWRQWWFTRRGKVSTLWLFWVTGWNKVCKTYYWKEMELWHFKWFGGGMKKCFL